MSACPLCGRAPAYAGAIYCGAGCSARAEAGQATLCPNCSERRGTMRYSADMGSFAAVRYMANLPMWCELCIAREQLKHAEERAAAIPELRARIALLEQAHVKAAT